MASAAFKAPQISQAELQGFFEAHFSESAIENFATRFLQPPQDAVLQAPPAVPADGGEAVEEEEFFDEEEEEYYYYEEEEDDGLGYYPDGVKRTLTDEQIAMFRHSELEALQRAKEKRSLLGPRQRNRLQGDGDSEEKPTISDIDAEAMDDSDLSEGEIASEPKPKGKKKKKKKKNNRRRPNHNNNNKDREEFVDLRKRTWDVVETGLGTLAYDEEEGTDAADERPAQRRKISYEDD